MQRYGAHGVDYLELAPAPFEVFEDLLPMDAGGKELQAGACGAGAAGSESQPYLEGGIEAADLFGGGWAVPDACGLGLGRTVGHGPYRSGRCRIGPYWGGAGTGCAGAPGRETRPTGGAFSQFWSVFRVLDWGSCGLG